MPMGPCGGCGKITNSTTSNWWLTNDLKPTECYAAYVDNKWVKGCAYEKIVGNIYMQPWIDDVLKNEVTI